MEADGKILIRLPGTGVVVDYANQRERDLSLKLAEARQRQAERTGYIPAWEQLTEEEREGSALEARNWLRAAAWLTPARDGIIVSRDDLHAVISVLSESIPSAMLARFREATGEADGG